MSGIYIPGMKMPMNCTDCWFRKTARHEYLSDCQLCPFTGDTTPYLTRDKKCPLVPVPDHGDLIDREELCDGRVSNDNVVICANTAPTIIPADKEE